MRFQLIQAACLAALFRDSLAACPSSVTGSFPSPVAASGYTARLFANGISSPRGIAFDNAGHLLVISRGTGVVALTLKDDGGECVSVASKKTIVSLPNLNHGIEFSHDYRKLYVSTTEAAYSYSYNPKTLAIGSRATLVNNMTNGDHVTRTLLSSKKQPGTLIISRGSNDNLDQGTLDIKSGRSQIKAFSVGSTPSKPYDYASQGRLLGFGLRNDVGVAEHPVTGGIWSVENSADNLNRLGTDIHQHNPAEELNYLGTLINNKSPNQGKTFGYPTCFTAWQANEVPSYPGLQTGQQFALNPNSSYTDAYCKNFTVAPVLAFDAHMAPLDIKFTPDGNTAYISFHGSFDRSVPAGYKIGKVLFKNGVPVKPSNSQSALIDVVTSTNASKCAPNTCFRPVGIALDSKGRIYWSSDGTDELYIINPTS